MGVDKCFSFAPSPNPSRQGRGIMRRPILSVPPLREFRRWRVTILYMQRTIHTILSRFIHGEKWLLSHNPLFSKRNISRIPMARSLLSGDGKSERSELMNTGDTAFVLVSSALVMLMTPGLALFYGGMVRGKNVLRTILWGF